MSRQRSFPFKAFLVALALALGGALLVSCGATSLPGPDLGGGDGPGNGDDDQGSRSPSITNLRFNFDGAIGVQLGGASVQGAATTSNVSSNLVAVLSDGSLRNAVVEGSVHVRDIFVRNGKIYALLTRDEGDWQYDDATGEEVWRDGTACVLIEIGESGEVTCIDPDLEEIDVRTIQFDAHGGIYYRGYASDQGGNWRSVIRRFADGATRDYYVADDATTIDQFLVTRDGRVIASGNSSGSVSYTFWLRLLGDPTTGIVGRDLSVSRYDRHHIFGFLPDGTILAERNEWTEQWSIPEPRRIYPDSDLTWDARAYVEQSNHDAAPARFQFDFWQFRNAFTSRYTSAHAMFGVVPDGVLMMFPDVRFLDLPVDQVNNAELRSNVAVISGTEGMARRALYVDLRTESYVDMLNGANLDVLRVLLELDRGRVLMYAIDIGRNEPVLAEYDIERDVLNTTRVHERLADSFRVLDWRIDHVPPAHVPWQPTVDVTHTYREGIEANRVDLAANAVARPAFIDTYIWDFGTGEGPVTVPGWRVCGDSWPPHCIEPGHVEAVYAQPGTYEITLTVVTDLDQRATASAVVDVEFGIIQGVTIGGSRALLWTDDGMLYRSGSWPSVGASERRHWRPVDGWSVQPAGVAKVVVSPGGHALALLSDGRLFGWGTNRYGQVGNGARTDVEGPGEIVFPTDASIIDVAAGSEHSLAITSAGEIYAWGRNAHGQLGLSGDPIPAEAVTPQLVAVPSDGGPVTGFVNVAATDYGSYAVRSTGQVFSWGSGSLGRESVSWPTVPEPVTLDGSVVSMATGRDHVLARTEAGSLYAWGSNYYSQTGTTETPEHVTLPVEVDGDLVWTLVGAGDNTGFGLTQDGHLMAWGENWSGQLGIPSQESVRTPTQVRIVDEGAVQQVASGGSTSFVLTADGSLYGAGYNVDGVFGNGSEPWWQTETFIRLR